jgi:hypothetical protein
MASLLVPMLLIYYLSTRLKGGWYPLLLFVGGLVVMIWGVNLSKAST